MPALPRPPPPPHLRRAPPPPHLPRAATSPERIRRRRSSREPPHLPSAAACRISARVPALAGPEDQRLLQYASATASLKMEQKAVWDVDATRIFCEICAKEANDGNRPTTSLSGTGYKNLIEEFHKQTGRLYNKKQMKNRWDELKGIWTAWVYYTNKATGRGWDLVKQTITASDEEWSSMIKAHKDIKCFRRGTCSC